MALNTVASAVSVASVSSAEIAGVENSSTAKNVRVEIARVAKGKEKYMFKGT